MFIDDTINLAVPDDIGTDHMQPEFGTSHWTEVAKIFLIRISSFSKRIIRKLLIITDQGERENASNAASVLARSSSGSCSLS